MLKPEHLASAVELALEADPGERRRALPALLSDERIRVSRDEASGFPLEGVFRLGAEQNRPGSHRAAEPVLKVVAGYCFETCDAASRRSSTAWAASTVC
jgi:hypothetical protein